MSNDSDRVNYPSPVYSWYVVGVLTIAYVFSFVDRQIINLMVAPIQRDLQINDTQISLLQGFSFVIFYTLFGIPLGRLADTGNRRAIISVGIAFWSLMTAACGLTKRFWDLALARMGVGVGEAALSPAAYSLISDYFPPHRRSTAMSVYSMGIYLGSGMAFVLGGIVIRFVSTKENFILPYLGEVRNWQVVFFLVGLPGLLVALLMLTIKEPIRHSPKNLSGPNAHAASLREVWQYVKDNKATFICLNLGVSMITLNSYAATSWIPSLFVRRFEWSPERTGIVYGTIIGTLGTTGVVFGGWLADRWTAQGRSDAQVRVAWIAAMCNLPFAICYPLAGEFGHLGPEQLREVPGLLTAVFIAPMVFFGSMPFGVAPAAVQRMMPGPMRATATAIYLFVINIIGMGLGPYFTARLTEDYFHDKKAVHLSLLIVGATSYLLASLMLGICLKNYRGSLQYLKNWTASQSNPAI